MGSFRKGDPLEVACGAHLGALSMSGVTLSQDVAQHPERSDLAGLAAAPEKPGQRLPARGAEYKDRNQRGLLPGMP
jgi:hypothetical protein